MENINDNSCLPDSLHEYAFGSGIRAGIALLGNDAGGFAGLSRPLRRNEAYEMLEACLSQELQAVSPRSRQKIKLAVARLWAELDAPSALDAILARHRHLYYAWKNNGDIDPIGVAVIDDAIDRIDKLLELGHSVNSAEDQFSPLHLAVDDENELMAAALIERGAAVSALDERGRSPLSYAAMHGAEAIVSRLLAAGADPMSIDEGGKTALILAAENGHRACALLLLPLSDCEHQDAQGQTATDRALTHWPKLASEMSAFALAARERDAIAEGLLGAVLNDCPRKTL